MSYVERSLGWFFRNRVVRGFSILSGPTLLLYSILTLIWFIITPVFLVFHNIFGMGFVTVIIQLEIATILSFLISGIMNYFISSLKKRIFLTFIILITFFVLFLTVIPIQIQFYVPLIGAIINPGIIGMAAFISIRAFNTSWVGRMMMIGKPPKKIFMHRIAMFINTLSILAPIFLFIRYFQDALIYDLILSFFGFCTLGLLMYATMHFPDLYAYDIFASILSATYLIVLIFYFLYITTILVAIVFDLIFLLFAISTLVQVLYSRRKSEKVSVMVPKAVQSLEDSNIIIIQDEDESEKARATPIFEESEYSIEQETTEVRSNYEGIIIIILGLTLSFHFIPLQLIAFAINYPGFLSFPFPFNLIDYQFVLFLLGYCLIIAIFIAFKVSLRFRSYTTKTMSERAAFLKFLTLIDKNERKRFLLEISKTVRDILVGGIMDLIEGERSRIGEELRKGRKFLRRLFGINED